MSVRVEGQTIHVEGTASVGDAEPLLAALLEQPARTVDLGKATHLHSAVVQLLLALEPVTIGQPADRFYETHIATLLDTGKG